MKKLNIGQKIAMQDPSVTHFKQYGTPFIDETIKKSTAVFPVITTYPCSQSLIKIRKWYIFLLFDSKRDFEHFSYVRVAQIL